MDPTIVSIPSVDVAPAFYQILERIVGLYPSFVVFVKNFIGIVIGISFPLSLFFFIVIIYSVERLKRIRKKEAERYDAKVEPAYEQVEIGDALLAKRWQSVKQHIESTNPNDWRQAIMDADIILEDLLTKMGYRGDSIGEKLKRVERGDFVTLNDAWEAHKVRNQIAHEGTGFSLNHHEAKRVIDCYRRVFDEFYYI